MNRDRLQTVLRVRGLRERRRMADHAAAQRRLREREEARREAEEARRSVDHTPARAARASTLMLHRLGALAHDEAVERAAAAEAEARAAAARTEELRVEAAVDRRSVERLSERREQEEAHEAEQLEGRRTDEVALQVWRRGR